MLVSRRAVCWLTWAMLLCATQSVFAARDYALEPQQVAPNTYVLIGANEHFSFANGGNIANTGFIVTDDGVVVIDTGPSRLYGEQMIAAIRAVTDQPIVRVYNTHLHPDHFLGNQAFDASVSTFIPITFSATRHSMQACWLLCRRRSTASGAMATVSTRTCTACAVRGRRERA